MQKTTIEFNKSLFEVLIGTENVNFLCDLNFKQEKIEDELKDIDQKKQSILSKLSETKEKAEMYPKNNREFLNNTESVLESVEIIYKNLSELQNRYREIESSMVLITEKLKLNIKAEDYTDEIHRIISQIEHTKKVEENIKADNEKNYYIVNGFLDKSINDNKQIQNNMLSNDLTLENLSDNLVLKISENRVELPYTKDEIQKFMEFYPNEYKTVQDVIRKEFIVHIATYNKHPILSRFREAYYLCRNKEMMTIVDSFIFAKNIMFRSDINPYIIAAVKSKKQLEDYIDCLEKNTLDSYSHFKIVFEVNPLAI